MKKAMIVLLSTLSAASFASKRVVSVQAHEKAATPVVMQQQVLDKTFLAMTTVKAAAHSASITSRAVAIAHQASFVA